MIKTIIFDFDNTLYENATWDKSDGYCMNLLKRVTNLSEKEVVKKFNEYGIKAEDIFADKAVDFLFKFKNTAKDLVKELQTNIYNFEVENTRFVNGKLIDELAKNYNLYITSYSAKEYCVYYLKKYGINYRLFKGIYQNKFYKYDTSKYPIYKHILKRENIKSSEILVVGDSKAKDLKPAEKLGFKTKQVYCLNDTIKIIEELNERKI